MLPGFEVRDSQLAMAEAVARTCKRGGVLAVEAPTGIGKSLAYLVPAALQSLETGLPVIVATHTRNLQDQLVEKDVPLVRAAFQRAGLPPVEVAVVKGRQNYACRRRIDAWLGTSGATDTRARVLTDWLAETETGEWSDAAQTHHPLHALRPSLCAEQGSCVPSLCWRGDLCFLRRMRDQARRAHVVVANHALLFTHLLYEGGALPDADTLILDEAHHVEAALLDASGRALGTDTVEMLICRALGGGRRDRGDLGRLERRLSGLTSDVDRLNALTRIRAVEGSLREAASAVQSCLAGVGAWLEGAGSRQMRYSLVGGDAVASADELIDARFDTALAASRAAVDRLGELVRSIDAANTRAYGAIDDGVREAAGMFGAWQALHRDLDGFTRPGDREVTWAERQGGDARLCALPLAVDTRMLECCVERFHATVMTSATLTVAGSFDHFAERLGLGSGGQAVFGDLSLETPFDYAQACRFVLATGFAPPSSERYITQLCDTLVGLIEAVPVRMLVLFTSYTMLRRAAQDVAESCCRSRRPLLVQGRDGPRRELAAAHRRRAGSVLFATQSFWEGVDFRGAELEMVVLARLPFPVPSEPLIAARSDRLLTDGRSAFNELHLPEAVLRFRQGFGRLIRSRADSGVVVCLDARLATASYRQVFLQSVPVEPVAASAPADVVRAVQAFFRERQSRSEQSQTSDRMSGPAPAGIPGV